MKIKTVLKFYFNAEKIGQMIDRLILKKSAEVDFYRSAEECAGQVIGLIEKKRALCSLWKHLDSAMRRFSTEERSLLENYALSLNNEKYDKKEVHRLVVTFSRRICEGISRFGDGIEVMKDFIIF